MQNKKLGTTHGPLASGGQSMNDKFSGAAAVLSDKFLFLAASRRELSGTELLVTGVVLVILGAVMFFAYPLILSFNGIIRRGWFRLWGFPIPDPPKKDGEPEPGLLRQMILRTMWPEHDPMVPCVARIVSVAAFLMGVLFVISALTGH
jgi:hypothetical protein